MWIYNVIISIYGIGIYLLSFFNAKAKKWIIGRSAIESQYPIVDKENVIWFHCASLGEFEQAKPVIENWKLHFPNDYILITFFSPSGYEIQKNNSLAHYCCYLPLDTPKNASNFIRHFKPQKAFFVKYEFWLNYINIAAQNNCQLYSISTLLRSNQRFFKWYGGIFKRALRSFDHFFVQNKNTFELLKKLGIDKVTISGDTRYDRVIQRSKESKGNIIIESWINSDDVTLIIGSCWSDDLEILIPFINSNKIYNKYILAPHQIDKQQISSIQNRLQASCELYLDCQEKNNIQADTKVVIINCIGILAEIYKYGKIAYVGGGFHGALHNILEPAAFGLPVLFGPKFKKFPEASQFLSEQIGKSIEKSDQLIEESTNFVANHASLSTKSFKFIESQSGATKIILNYFC